MNTPLYRLYDNFHRAYIKDNYYVHLNGNVGILRLPDGEDLLMGKGNIKHLIPCFPNTIIVERCMGLKDINGNWIYEGDRVSYDLTTHRSDTITESYEATVLFRNGEFRPRSIVFDCEDEHYSYEKSNLKIIGNIHEIPELLKETEDETTL